MKTTIEESNTIAIARLAKQLNKDSERFAAEILRAGIQAIDDTIGNNCHIDVDPPYFFAGTTSYDLIHTCTISGIIERMDGDELADAQKEATNCGQQLQEIIRERYSRGTDMERLQ